MECNESRKKKPDTVVCSKEQAILRARYPSFACLVVLSVVVALFLLVDLPFLDIDLNTVLYWVLLWYIIIFFLSIRKRLLQFKEKTGAPGVVAAVMVCRCRAISPRF